MKMYFIISFLLLLSFGCGEKSPLPESKRILHDKDSIAETQPKVSLTENQQKVLNGAKEVLKDRAEYDLSMAYYVLTYKDGENTGKKVYPEGDLDPAIGVCTDVVVRALRKGNVADLQEEINKDVTSSFPDYPMSRWGKKKADPNIDHRRVMNLEVWFSKYWEVVTDNNFQPGDIVVWDMNQDGASDHIGIVSDKYEGGKYYVIHNHPDPGYTAEENKLERWEIAGHYRIK